MARWGRTDYRQLVQLRDRMERLQGFDVDLFCKKCAKELAARLLSKVIKNTPVGQYPSSTGKVGGTLRRGWTTHASREAELNAVFNGSENVTKYVNELPIKELADGYEIEIINPVSYALNMGHVKLGKIGESLS